MNFRSLRAEIEFAHRGDTSLQVRLDGALRQLEEALGVLSRSGHHFHLAFGHEAHSEFPKTMYHFWKGQRLVRSEADLKELGWGWYPSLRDAEYAEGRDVQFAGRGGVRRRNLPSELNGQHAEFVPVGPSKEELKEDFLRSRHAEGPILSDSPDGGL